MDALQQARTTPRPVLLVGDPRRGKSSVLRQQEETLGSVGWSVTSLSAIRLQSQSMQETLSALRTPLSRTGRRALLVDDLSRLWKTEVVVSGALGEVLQTLTAEGVWVLLADAAGAVTAAQRQSRGLGAVQVLPLPVLAIPSMKMLLNQGTDLSTLERLLLETVCGGEPYFLQAFAGTIVSLPPGPRRVRQAGHAILTEVDRTLAGAWRSTPSAERWALLVLALNQIDPGVSVVQGPLLPDLAQASVLALLCQLSRTELKLLSEAACQHTLDPHIRRGEAVGAVLRQLSSASKQRNMLSILLSWRPDLVFEIKETLSHVGGSLQAVDALQGLISRDIAEQRDGRLVLRAPLRVWWMLEQLSPVARGDVPLMLWLQSQGLLPPSSAAIAHLQWRITRLEGILSRGARGLMDSTLTSLSFRAG